MSVVQLAGRLGLKHSAGSRPVEGASAAGNVVEFNQDSLIKPDS